MNKTRALASVCTLIMMGSFEAMYDASSNAERIVYQSGRDSGNILNLTITENDNKLYEMYEKLSPKEQDSFFSTGTAFSNDIMSYIMIIYKVLYDWKCAEFVQGEQKKIVSPQTNYGGNYVERIQKKTVNSTSSHLPINDYRPARIKKKRQVIYKFNNVSRHLSEKNNSNGLKQVLFKDIVDETFKFQNN